MFYIIRNKINYFYSFNTSFVVFSRSYNTNSTNDEIIPLDDLVSQRLEEIEKENATKKSSFSGVFDDYNAGILPQDDGKQDLISNIFRKLLQSKTEDSQNTSDPLYYKKPKRLQNFISKSTTENKNLLEIDKPFKPKKVPKLSYKYPSQANSLSGNSVGLVNTFRKNISMYLRIRRTVRRAFAYNVWHLLNQDYMLRVFRNFLMRDGKRSLASRTLRGALELIKLETFSSPLSILRSIFRPRRQFFNIKSKLLKYKSIQIPSLMSPRKQFSMIIRQFMSRLQNTIPPVYVKSELTNASVQDNTFIRRLSFFILKTYVTDRKFFLPRYSPRMKRKKIQFRAYNHY